MEEKKEHEYDDIINLPHHVSTTHLPMTMINRAAQFAPFAALTGYDEAVEETARITSEKMELDEDYKAFLDEQLYRISKQIQKKPKVKITYYQADEKKDGGSYLNVTGNIKRIYANERVVILTEDRRIPMDDIVDIQEVEE